LSPQKVTLNVMRKSDTLPAQIIYPVKSCPGYSFISRGLMSSSMPSSTCVIRSLEIEPIFSTISLLSTVKIWVILMTLSFVRFASPLLSITLPGECALWRFEVKEHTTTVLMRLLLNKLF